MLVRAPGGTCRTGKRRISEAANRHADQFGVKLHVPIQRSPTVRAEVRFEPTTRVRLPGKSLRPPACPHLVTDVVRPRSEWRPGPTLACSTAADNNTTWLTLTGGCELSTRAGCHSMHVSPPGRRLSATITFQSTAAHRSAHPSVAYRVASAASSNANSPAEMLPPGRT